MGPKTESPYQVLYHQPQGCPHRIFLARGNFEPSCPASAKVTTTCHCARGHPQDEKQSRYLGRRSRPRPTVTAEVAQLERPSHLCLLRAESDVSIKREFPSPRVPGSNSSTPSYANGHGNNHSAVRTPLNVDISSLLKSGGDSNESYFDIQRQQSRPSSVPLSTTAPIVSTPGQPPSYVNTPAVAAPSPMPGGGGGGRRGGAMPPQQVPEQPVKKQSKWTPDEDALIIELRGSGMKWEDISKRLPGRSAISCRLHYQNYLERRSEWDEERKNKLARLYERFKSEMWSKVAEELAVPWRAAEAMHWLLGEADMARRAGVVPFSLAAVNVEGSQVARHSPQRTHPMPPPGQGAHHREVVPATHHRELHARAHSMSTAQGGPPRRDVYAAPPPPPPALAPAPPPPPHVQAQPPTHPSTTSPMAHIKSEFTEQAFAPPVPGPGLAPIQTQPRQRSGDYLPGIAELTTGVGPYGLGAPAAPTSAPSTGPPPAPSAAYQGYQALEPMRLKRQASTEAGLNEPTSRRRVG